MDMGFSEEEARTIYETLRDELDTPHLTTRIIGWLRKALIYLFYILAALFSCVAAILWYTGHHIRAIDWARRLRRCLNSITKNFTRAWNWLLHEQLSQLLDHLAFRINLSRYFLTHHLSRTGHWILQAGIVDTMIYLPPYILHRILTFFLKPPHERENNGGFDAAFAIAIHACIDHPVRIILAILTALYCLNGLIGTNDNNNNQECYRCLRKNKNVSMASVDVAKLCEKHRAAEDAQRKWYYRRVQRKEREMIRERSSPSPPRREVASSSRLPAGKEFTPVPWHPLPLYDFSSVFPEAEEVDGGESQEFLSSGTAQSVGSGPGHMGYDFGVSEWDKTPSFTSTPSIVKGRKERFF